MVRPRTFFPRPIFVSHQENVGLCDRITLDGQVHPAHYGKRGACVSDPPPEGVLYSMFGLDNAPRTRLTCGGVKEKVLGAHRTGANKVIVPLADRKDVEHDVPKEVRSRVQFVFAWTVRQALDAAFGERTLPWRTLALVVESRL